MARRCVKSSVPLTFSAAIFLVGLATSRAQAQWGMGFGGMGYGAMGWGFGLFRPAPSPTQYLYNHSLVLTAQGMQGPTNNRPYGDSPNAYFNHIRDNGFVPRYEVNRRQPSYHHYTNPNPEPQAAAPAPRPIQPLSSFFEGTKPRLLWPGDAPLGELKAKRELADQAALQVYSELRQNGVASVASAAEARQKLIDYGRPALEQVKERGSVAVADSFHHFLLSLYDSLAAAATPTLAAAATPRDN